MSEAICGADTPVQSEARSPDRPEPSAAWQPIETAPKDGTQVLTWGTLHGEGEDAGETPAQNISWYGECGWVSPAWGSHVPVLWQPLPAAPGLSGSGGGDPATTASSVAPLNPSAREAGRLREALEKADSALTAATEVASQARDEWDTAPQGMKAGKLLIALSGELPGYRPDIDAIHRIKAEVRAALSTETGDQS